MAYEVSYSATKFFLDRAEVQRKLGVARVRALGRQGAFVRRRARTSILRRRKRISAPGSPPSVHSKGSIDSLRNILFAYEQSSDSVVVGPVKLNQINRSRSGSISIPALMEFGGRIEILEERYPGTRAGMWFRSDLRTRRRYADRIYRNRPARYRPRPFMLPALEAEIAAGTIVSSWANVVKG